MGYRSDVFIGIRKQDEAYFVKTYKEALKALDTAKEPYFEAIYQATTLEDALEGKIYKEDSNGKIIVMNCVKWYESYHDVKAAYSTFNKFEEKELPYEVIEIGEDGQTTMHRFTEENCDEADALGFEMYVEQYVEVDGMINSSINITKEAERLLSQYNPSSSAAEIAMLCAEMAHLCQAIVSGRA